MMRPPGRPKEKTAVALPGNTTAFQRSQHANGTAPQPDLASTPMVRSLLARLAQLGLAHSGADDESILIAGQAYDLRTATAMARQLGASS
jgi:hypothetical protein